MHELAVAQALLDQIEIAARPHGAVAVHAATIKVGPLSGVEPALLRRAFEVARLVRPTTTETILMLETSEVVVSCSACGREGAASVGKLCCTHCSSPHTSLRSGDELLLMRIEMEMPAVPSAVGERHV